MEEIDVVVAGHACLDVTPVFPDTGVRDMSKLLIPGKIVNVHQAVVSCGGPVSNTGINLITLGIKTKLMAKIGNDFFGNGLQDVYSARGVNGGMTVVDGEETSYTVALTPPGIDRIFLHNPGANNTFRAEDVDYDLVSRAKIFHLGYPPLMKALYSNEGEELIEIYRRVKKLGVTTSLDMSLPDASSPSGQVNWDGILKTLLPYVDIYLPSVEETMYMIARDKFDYLNAHGSGHDILAALTLDMLNDVGSKLMDYGARIASLKSGYRGFYLRTASKDALSKMGTAPPADLDNWANRELHEEAFHIEKVASATGAGDSSIAGFLSGYLRGKSIEDTIRIACTVGGQNVTMHDAVSGIKPWEETLAMSRQDRPRNPISGSPENWRKDEERGVWVGRNDRGFGK